MSATRCSLKEESACCPKRGDYETFFADTLAAGHYENRRESVDIMIRSSRSAINDLVALGCDFERDWKGMLAFTREGAHSRPRICYHADTTGKEITTTLLAAVRRLPNVRILDHVAMVDILTKEPGCQEDHAQGCQEDCTQRAFEKAAVAIGGGRNHRYNLSTAVMLKDNHIDAAGGIAAAVAAARARAPFTCTVEVECEDLAMVREAVEAGADIIMLDNMTHDEMAAAISLIDGRAKTECSGNVDAGNIRALADLGVDYISSGALTHSAPILDLSLKHLRLLDDARTSGVAQ